MNVEIVERPATEATQPMRERAACARHGCVQKANSGHPGMPMGMAEIAEVLWRRHLRHNPANPSGRPRPLRALERSRLHAAVCPAAPCGYDLPMEEIKRFRQLHSKRPDIPNTGSPPASRRRRDRSDRASRMRSAWRSRRRCSRPSSTVRACGRRSLHLCSWRRLHDGGHIARGVLARRDAGPGKLMRSTTTNGISIDGRVEGWSPTTRRNVSRATAGMSWPMSMGTTARQCTARSSPPRQSPTGLPSSAAGRSLPKARPTRPDTRGAWRGAWRERDCRDARGDRLEPSAVRDSAARVQGVGRARAGCRGRGDLAPEVRRVRARLSAETRECERRLNGELPADLKRACAS